MKNSTESALLSQSTMLSRQRAPLSRDNGRVIIVVVVTARGVQSKLLPCLRLRNETDFLVIQP